MWRDQQSGQVVSRHDQIRALRPNVSFPAALTDAIIAAHGFDPIGEGNKPSVTEHQSAVRGDQVQDGAAWVFSWTVRDWTQEEIAAYEAAKVPQVVTPRQGRAILIKRGHLAQIQALLDAMEGLDGELARNDFATAQEWLRTWPLIEQMRVSLGWTSAYVDELFTEAAKL